MPADHLAFLDARLIANARFIVDHNEAMDDISFFRYKILIDGWYMLPNNIQNGQSLLEIFQFERF